MKPTTFCLIAGVFFAAVALAHIARIIYNVPVHIGSLALPMWMSWAGAVVTGILSSFGFRAAGH